MKILLLNPNTSPDLTERMAGVGRAAMSAGFELVPVTASRGVPYIASRAEADIAAAVALEMLAEHGNGHDAAIIAAFGDPGLHGARELLSTPVVGMAEAAMLTACMLGRRFAIVTFSSTLAPWYRECVERNGLDRRFAGLWADDAEFASVAHMQEHTASRLVDLARRAALEGEADAVILGGAPLAGLAEHIKTRVPVPVVDGVVAAVKQVEVLLAQRTVKATAGSFRRPAGKASFGLAEPLADLIAGIR